MHAFVVYTMDKIIKVSNNLYPDLDHHFVWVLSGSKLFAKVLSRQQKLWQARKELTLYLIETPFNAFANRADPDQAVFAH